MKVNFAPTSLREEIEQNIDCILETIQGTAPLARGFGLDKTDVDSLDNLIEARMTNKVITAIQEHEPRVQVTEVYFPAGEDGKIKPKVKYVMVEEGEDTE
ncbi:GPW/gp25 family protein [Paenibacillus agilis]|uniref:GPW/gp25 family protein n=1 Tax=Paenibacillus agilis TaxID=3020863 RepID=A0A559IZK7_9BACL|nr:GPW/gp25 family protein [Paenibacillus agilis]TVX93054.1 GPW/gp25 family protein [Paenibacillus agilis]